MRKGLIGLTSAAMLATCCSLAWGAPSGLLHEDGGGTYVESLQLSGFTVSATRARITGSPITVGAMIGGVVVDTSNPPVVNSQCHGSAFPASGEISMGSSENEISETLTGVFCTAGFGRFIGTFVIFPPETNGVYTGFTGSGTTTITLDDPTTFHISTRGPITMRKNPQPPRPPKGGGL